MKGFFRRAAAVLMSAAAFCGFSNTAGLSANAMQADAVSVGATDQAFEKYMTSQGFPDSYKPYLRTMHQNHPNWVFTAQKTGLNWNTVLAEECVVGRNLVHDGAPDSWKSCEKGAFDAPSGTWYGLDGTWVGASQGIIAYYLDPRNFINDDYIFMFENQSYNKNVHNINGVKAILKGTFMKGKFTARDTGKTYTYAQTFMDAAAKSGVSPYHLASRCRNEQGVNGAPQSLGTVPGYEGYYNFFDINAYYTATMTAGEMACKYASTTDPTYMLPWTNQYKSIVGGSIYLGSGYINRSQDTLYLQKFDVIDGGNGLYYHQYMTCVFGQANEAVEMKNAYTSEVLASAIEFKIPVYSNMPSSACTKPSSTGDNNNLLTRFDAITNTGVDLLANFYRYTTDYTFTVDSNVSSVTFKCIPYSTAATVSGAGKKTLEYGDNTFTVKVKASSGVIRSYTLHINRKGGTTYKKGDVNADGKIDVKDALLVMNFTSGKKSLTSAQKTRADVTGDGKVDVKDSMKIMRYVSGKIKNL